LAAVPVGALVAIPAIRLPGVFLAVATLGFGVLLEQLIYPMNFMFTTDQSGIPTPRPSGGIGAWQFGSDIGFFYVLLLFALGTVATMALIVKGPLGRILKAMSYSRIALETGGLSTRTPQMLVFCISAFFASLSGALAASLANFAVGTSFPSFQSLIIFAVVVVTAIGEPWYAIIGAAGLALIPSYVTSPNAAVYLQLAFGIAAVGYVFSSARPLTVPLLVRRLADRLDGAFRRTPSPAQTTSATTLVPRRSKGEGLVVRNLTVQYGAVIAINDLSLDVPLGKITALIGPNGAGKTSTFNACSALIKPRSGIFEIGGMNISTFSSPKRARAGLGRGFQQPQLYDGLSVTENVRMGREAPLSGRNVVRQMMSGGKSQRAISASASEAMRLVGIEKLADTDCGLLSAGQRRLTELARCLAGDFDVLLLDEPSAGLDRRETALFAEVLKKAVRERNIGILIVEHDMDLVLGISDRIHVVDFGVKIFEGSPDEVMTSDTVRKAYLGTMLAGQS
jgi:ABC-type branched-subunit amino acid transport system ATPase component/branched-subunit amino acid ABC-type transport system permease component